MTTTDPTTTTVLGHSVRRWEAEVENARRLSNRENGILGVIAMLLGLGLFRGPTVEAAEPAFLFWIARGLLSLAILQVLAALGLVLWMGGRASRRTGTDRARPAFASSLLRWRAPRLMSDVTLDEVEANLLAKEAMTEAADDLLRRNIDRKWTLDVSQRFLFGAAACAGIAMSCYLYLRTGNSN